MKAKKEHQTCETADKIYLFSPLQCLETLTHRQMDMQKFIADGCKEALLEEKRRFCFLVDKHCTFSYQFAAFHEKVIYIRHVTSRFGWISQPLFYKKDIIVGYFFVCILHRMKNNFLFAVYLKIRRENFQIDLNKLNV